MYKKNNSRLDGFAKHLRKNMTKEERHLWYDFLCNYPVKFTRQKIVESYILDFYCSKAKIAIELDGSQHYKPEAREYDKQRTEFLKKHGIDVIRILNRDVNNNFFGVCKYIDKKVSERIERNIPMNTKAIIFDLDGVITDSAKYHFEAWKELADRLGYKFDEDDNERLKGVSRLDSLNIILEINNALDAFTLEEKEAMCTEKNDNYVNLIAKVTPEDILPGIAKFMADAKAAGLKLAVASVSKNAPALLTSLGIIEEFDYIADARKISKSKPDPEIFTVCAEALGIAPENCIGVEDSQAGIEAINAAGMKSIGINVTVTSITPDLPLKSTAELDFATMVD